MATHERNRRSSQDTLISLMQLEPSPIDSPVSSPAPTDKELPDLPDEATDGSSITRDGSTAAPGLSGSGRGAIYYC